jgi:MOSC domain-containing protein YiiM
VLRIVRLGAKPYQVGASFPRGSNNYTTRKHSQSSVLVSKHGVEGDYNHYRNVALRNTTDRAVSIVMRGTIDYVRTNGYPLQPGDLGENVLLEAADSEDGGDGSFLIRALRPGSMLHVVGESPSYGASGAVVLQISEPMVPCANLCTLPHVQNPRCKDGTAEPTPRERVEACQNLLQVLDAHVGLRGWYARVLQPGELRVGDQLELLEP